MKTETAKTFLALGIAMIITAFGSPTLFELITKSEFPQQFMFFNFFLITIGAVLTYSGIRNIWVNGKNENS